MTPVRLLVTDVDGTLVRSDRTLAPGTLLAAAALRRAGIRLALVSARATAGLDMLLEPLGIDTPRAGFNGGAILAPDNRVVAEHVLEPGASREAVALLEGHGLDIWVFADNEWLLTDPDGFYIPSEQRSIAMPWRRVGDFAPFHGRIHKIMGSSRDTGLVASASADLQARLQGRAAVLRSQLYYIDVTPPLATKGDALRRIARELGIDPAEVAAIGDMPNDLPMFEAAALSFAMGNAPDAVKRAATHVVADHDREGWAEAVRILLAHRPPG
ncbi:Cof-type HAD-IIB family hydrolase [Rhizosaccharibacter radicis]|uniref:Cof-type HAD-IIB family hydrolase n=1 Tax=Rhizosaccharibacter radicis TaxID=2782605 RepID=A0ABT1W0P4_9PROT|nr:Cof-type HAD-IIB family hydrolase [Acetobacteraceae bacterium KSS12]